MISSLVEALESRIAPAATFTFIDLDGDVATITTSKGTNADLSEANGVLTFSAPDPGEPDVPRQLWKIDLSGSTATAVAFAGTDLSIKVTRKAAGGDGLVHVGFIDAREIILGGPDTDIELGAVTIGGDLGQIEAGVGGRTLAGELIGGVNSLSVQSLGLFGLATQGGTGDLVSIITGPLGSFKVRGDVREAGIVVRAGAPEDGFIGPVTIGGSLIGGDGPDTGVISASGDIGAVKIGGDVRGGDKSPGGGESNGSGWILASGKIASLTIGGSLLRGPSVFDGLISSGGPIGPVKIGRDVTGTLFAGIVGTADVTSVSVGGSVLGDISGKVMGAVRVAGDVTGDLTVGTLASVTIGGSVLGGSVRGLNVKVAGDVTGSIGAGNFGSVTIGGSVLGGSVSSDLGLRVVKIGGDFRGGNISVGVEMPGDPFVRKISAVSIGGSFIGVGTAGRIFSAGEIGTVKIGGDMIGDGDGSAIIRTIQTVSPDVTSHIGSVKIGGSLIGGAGVGSARIEVGERVGGATASGNLGPVTIGGSVLGDGAESGFIRATGTIAGIKIGGSLEGGAGQDSGKIFTPQALGAVKIGRDLRGGSGGLSGLIDGGTIAGIKIGGSLVGGPAPLSGAILSLGDIGPVKIARDLQGGSVTGSGGFDASGYISGDRIASISIGGSILAHAAAQWGGRPPADVRAIALVSTPLNLVTCCRAMHTGVINRLYMQNFLRGFRRAL
ncbi:MAG: hypothetical protein ABMA13_23705, partial [Chthoniobacteraceae bacterium]